MRIKLSNPLCSYVFSEIFNKNIHNSKFKKTLVLLIHCQDYFPGTKVDWFSKYLTLWVKANSDVINKNIVNLPKILLVIIEFNLSDNLKGCIHNDNKSFLIRTFLNSYFGSTTFTDDYEM
jgi:hypothetical protein